MAYNLIALDLDDTLLDADKNISSRNLAAVRDAQAEGARVIVASGRAYRGVLPYLQALGLHDYTIATGGAVTMNPDGTVAETDPISPQVTQAVIAWAIENGAYYQVYSGDGFMYPKRTRYTDRYEANNGFTGVHTPDLAARTDIAAGKILLIDSAQNIDRWGRQLRAQFPSLLIQTSHPTFLEISSAHASKGAALARLANRLGIARENVMAFGDSEIDRSMIEYAGLGVAVENATEDVRRSADYITESAGSDGVAAALEKFVIGRRAG